MSRSPTRPAILIDYATLAGPITIRPANIADGDRFKIDARDHAHTVVWVQAGLSCREASEVRDLIADRLAELLLARRRRELVPVAELEEDESDELPITGTDGASDATAWARRQAFEVVEREA